MKFATLSAIVAVATAQDSATSGDDCSAQPFICQNSGTSCVTYTDSVDTEVATCQDCQSETRQVMDDFGVSVMFMCPDDEGASSLYATVAAVLAVATFMA